MTPVLQICARFIVVFMMLCMATAAQAHETTRSYVTITQDDGAMMAQVRIAFRDIEVAVWMDENLDGNITWGETKQRLAAVQAYFTSVFQLDAGGSCTLTPTGADVSSDAGIDYLDLYFSVICPVADAPLTATSGLFAEIDPDHRMFLTANLAGATTTTLLSLSNPTVVINNETSGLLNSFLTYFKSGVEHLTGGTDHLVFLLVIMLPAVASGMGRRAAILNVIAVLTGFTAAHALSLTAAATELLRPPSTIIEILIALSIVVTAIDNVRPFIPAPRAAVAAFFGIIHGFGFASALGVLHLSGSGLAVALIGFNLGIEVAQIVLVVVALPILFLIGKSRVLLWAGSFLAGSIGMFWVWVRVDL